MKLVYCVRLAFCLALVPMLGCSPSMVGAIGSAEQQLNELTAAQGPPNLASRIDAVLSSGLQSRRLSSSDNAAWQIMHGVAAYGMELEIDTPDRGRVGAIEYVFSNGQVIGFELMAGNTVLPATGQVGVKARLEPGSYIGQGHVDQWLAIFAMAELPLDTPLQIGDQHFTLLDWARQAQWDVSQNILNEFSWTLIALTHYFPDEASWSSAGDHEVSWEMLVAEELNEDIDLSPCGGTHRLAGIVRALHAKQSLGLPDTETWDRAQKLVDRCLASAESYRNTDGTLSCNYFERPGRTADLSAELASAGHLFEFVALAAQRDQLSEPWVELAAHRLCESLESTRDIALDCGALYHALNGLKIYRHRLPQ